MSKFTESVDHYCDGLVVAVGCLGSQCEYANGDEHHQCESHFSWSQCDSCGSTLGGDRLAAYGAAVSSTGFAADYEPIPMSICVDCAMYHANGEEPESWED